MIGMGGTGGTRCPGVVGADRFMTPGMYAIWMMFDARVSTVDAMECTVCIDERFLRRSSKSFSDAVGSPSIPSHCSWYWPLRLLKRNLHIRYVSIKIPAIAPITPPAIAPVFGPAGVAGTALAVLDVAGAQTVDWHVSQVLITC
jgi:hypothetical protein